jgi:GNAT acetyltransferase-like protein
LSKVLSERGWVKLTRLTSGDRTFAWNYGFQFNDTWFWYQPTFDSDLEKYSPGFCLLAKIIEEAAADSSLKTVDLGLGAEEYKDRFCNESRRTLCVTLRASAASHVREIARHCAARVVKSSHWLEAVVRRIASSLHNRTEQVRRRGFLSVLGRLLTRLKELVWFEEEVYFFEWSGAALWSGNDNPGDDEVQPIDANQLAAAALQNADDPETLAYLLRAASRLRKGGARGFARTDAKGRILHLAWVTAFDGFFLAELNAKVDAPLPEGMMLFDCWTPRAMRGHGYYAETVGRIAQIVQAEGKKPWIFSAARNTSSVRGLEKSGFQRRYSLIRQRSFVWQRIKRKSPGTVEAPAAEVSAGV